MVASSPAAEQPHRASPHQQLRAPQHDVNRSIQRRGPVRSVAGLTHNNAMHRGSRRAGATTAYDSSAECTHESAAQRPRLSDRRVTRTRALDLTRRRHVQARTPRAICTVQSSSQPRAVRILQSRALCSNLRSAASCHSLHFAPLLCWPPQCSGRGALFTRLVSDGSLCLFAEFSGQGRPWLGALRELDTWARTGAHKKVAQFIDDCILAVQEMATDEEVAATGVLRQGFDVRAWIDQSQPIPEETYLSSSDTSLPAEHAQNAKGGDDSNAD